MLLSWQTLTVKQANVMLRTVANWALTSHNMQLSIYCYRNTDWLYNAAYVGIRIAARPRLTGMQLRVRPIKWVQFSV